MAKMSEVTVGSVWTARVSGKHVNVRVDSINKPSDAIYSSGGRKTRFGLTNLNTGRVLGARTAAFLRKKVVKYPF